MLSYKDQRVGEQVERHGETAALKSHHEFMPLEVGFLLVEYVHLSSVSESGAVGCGQ
jgi:hypothetical protein